jgi:hypothetical protein
MISGEQLQSLADISLYGDMTDLIDAQLKSKSQNAYKISELPIDDIKKYKVIYVYTHFLQEFFDKFFDSLNEIILITNNSDDGIHDKHLRYLEGSNIKKWYCQNRETSHPKLFSIPIGLANSQWPHGNQSLITQIRADNNPKKNLVYKNFDANTNFGERFRCNAITEKNNIFLSPRVSINEYWKTLSESLFVISPPGNGIDCHRIWEALYLKSVPVVIYHESFSQFKHLPILFVSDWSEITIEFLKSKINQFTGADFDIPELYISYWYEKIKEDKNYETN